MDNKWLNHKNSKIVYLSANCPVVLFPWRSSDKEQVYFWWCWRGYDLSGSGCKPEVQTGRQTCSVLPPTEAAYKSRSPASLLHFLFLSIKNDKLYLLKPLACFRVPVCTFHGGEARVRGSDLFYLLPLLGMNKRVINCVGVAAAQRQDLITQQAWSICLCYNTPSVIFW